MARCSFALTLIAVLAVPQIAQANGVAHVPVAQVLAQSPAPDHGASSLPTIAVLALVVVIALALSASIVLIRRARRR